MSVLDLVSELNRRGVDLRPVGDRLEIEAPEGAITGELLDSIINSKAELIANRERFQAIKARIAAAMIQAENKFPGRFNWSKDSYEAREAEQRLDEAMCQYLAGEGSLEAVQLAWQRFIHTLEVLYSAQEQKPQLQLIKT